MARCSNALWHLERARTHSCRLSAYAHCTSPYMVIHTAAHARSARRTAPHLSCARLRTLPSTVLHGQHGRGCDFLTDPPFFFPPRLTGAFPILGRPCPPTDPPLLLPTCHRCPARTGAFPLLGRPFPPRYQLPPNPPRQNYARRARPPHFPTPVPVAGTIARLLSV